MKVLFDVSPDERGPCGIRYAVDRDAAARSRHEDGLASPIRFVSFDDLSLPRLRLVVRGLVVPDRVITTIEEVEEASVRKVEEGFVRLERQGQIFADAGDVRCV